MDPCEICGISSFCNSCGKDGKCHQEICAPTHGERVLKYIDYLVRSVNGQNMTISRPCFDGKHVVRIFDVSYACGVCGEQGGFGVANQYHPLKHNVKYCLCDTCLHNNRRLCLDCGNDTQVCIVASTKIAYNMLLVRDVFSQQLLPELWRFIAITYYQMLPCA